MSIDRRRFLQLTAISIVATLADSACGRDRSSNPTAQPDLSAMLGADRVREIGTRYRAATPRENSTDSLRAALARSPGGSIDEQIHNDFEAGRTVLVDGWLLSITEARRAALFSLGAA